MRINSTYVFWFLLIIINGGKEFNVGRPRDTLQSMRISPKIFFSILTWIHCLVVDWILKYQNIHYHFVWTNQMEMSLSEWLIHLLLNWFLMNWLDGLVEKDEFEFASMSNVFSHLFVRFDWLNLLLHDLIHPGEHIEHWPLVSMSKEHLNHFDSSLTLKNQFNPTLIIERWFAN